MTVEPRSTYLAYEPLQCSRYNPDEQAHGDDEVWTFRTIELLGKRPCNSCTVQTLRFLAGLQDDGRVSSMVS